MAETLGQCDQAAASARHLGMGVRADCRHYSTRTLPSGEQVERCRLGVNEETPFACPEDCVFFEGRNITDTGWNR
jgi:hypothetical protein